MCGISTLLRVMYKRFQAVRDSDSEIVSTVSSSDSFKKRLKNNYPQNAPNQLPTSFSKCYFLFKHIGTSYWPPSFMFHIFTVHLAVHYTMMSVTLFYHIIIGFIFYLSDNTRMAESVFYSSYFPRFLHPDERVKRLTGEWSAQSWLFRAIYGIE